LAAAEAALTRLKEESEGALKQMQEAWRASQEAHALEVRDLNNTIETREAIHEQQIKHMMEAINELLLRSEPLGFMPKTSTSQFKGVTRA
jgi:hypothetical protein